MSDFLSIDELLEEPGVRYDSVKTALGKTVRISSCSSAEVLAWLKENEKPDAEFSGLRLLARSIVDKDGKHIGEGLPEPELKEARAEFVRKMALRDSVEVGVLCRKALELNGLRAPSDTSVEKILGNASSETVTAGSPAASPSH